MSVVLTPPDYCSGAFVKKRNTGRTQKISGIDGNVSGSLPD